LIRAFHILTKNLKPDTHNLKLLIVGDGPQREELFNLADELGVKDKVEFAGTIPNQDIYKYLAASFVFVRPSLSEGLGTAFLEAMAAGLPIVGTPVGGIPDFLKPARLDGASRSGGENKTRYTIRVAYKELSDQEAKKIHLKVFDL